MTSAASLTICSVSYGSGDYLRINRRQLLSLNATAEISWRVAENSPAGDRSVVTRDDGFVVYKGVPKHGEPHGEASYQHGRALNSICRNVDTRFLAVMDPDFFLRLDNGLDRITRHMQDARLAYFGVPWHPRWYTKFRSFPCVHCLFIDCSMIDVTSLDFEPDYSSGPITPRTLLPDAPMWRKLGPAFTVMNAVDRFSQHVLGKTVFRAAARATIGASRDTGSRVYASSLARPGLRAQVVDAVDSGLPLPSSDDRYVNSFFNRCIEGVLPDAARFRPRRAMVGMPPESARFQAVRPEHFSWNGEYFGFHVREFPRAQSDRQARIDELRSAME